MSVNAKDKRITTVAERADEEGVKRVVVDKLLFQRGFIVSLKA